MNEYQGEQLNSIEVDMYENKNTVSHPPSMLTIGLHTLTQLLHDSHTSFSSKRH
jgi:hypothetical protein